MSASRAKSPSCRSHRSRRGSTSVCPASGGFPITRRSSRSIPGLSSAPAKVAAATSPWRLASSSKWTLCPCIAGRWPHEGSASSVEMEGWIISLHNNPGCMAYGIDAFNDRTLRSTQGRRNRVSGAGTGPRGRSPRRSDEQVGQRVPPVRRASGRLRFWVISRRRNDQMSARMSQTVGQFARASRAQETITCQTSMSRRSSPSGNSTRRPGVKPVPRTACRFSPGFTVPNHR